MSTPACFRQNERIELVAIKRDFASISGSKHVSKAQRQTINVYFALCQVGLENCGDQTPNTRLLRTLLTRSVGKR
jgi:hypothetical protein